MRRILLFISGPILTGLFGVLTLPILSWMTTPESLGGVALFVTVISFLAIIFSVGLDAAITREFYESKNTAALIFSLTTSSLLFASLTLALATFVFDHDLIARWFPVSNVNIVWVLAAAALTELASKFFLVGFRLHGWAVVFSIGLAGPKALYLALLVGAFFILGELSFDCVVLMFLAAKMVTLMILVVVFLSSGVKLNIADFFAGRAVVLKSLRFGLPLVISGVAGLAMKSLDKILLAQLASLEELAVFALSVSFAVGVLLVHSVMTTLWVPAVYKWVAENELGGRLELSRRVMTGVCTIAGLAAVIVSPAIGWLLPDFYQPVALTLPAVTVAYLLYLLALVTGIHIKVARKTKYSMYISLVCVAVNAGLNILLIPSFGALGAAVATTLSFALYLLVNTEISALLVNGFRRSYIYFHTMVVSLSAILWGLFGKLYAVEMLWANGVVLVLLCGLYFKYFLEGWRELRSGYF